ncbi:hypothetical protein RZS08_59145, partial [Arthrospira platensis SPKY1]|nr:hypothetical protein [Arthrospira platensis SPKY1]
MSSLALFAQSCGRNGQPSHTGLHAAQTTHCLVWVGDSLYRRPAVFPESDSQEWVEMRDTFVFFNTCADTLFLDRG